MEHSLVYVTIHVQLPQTMAKEYDIKLYRPYDICDDRDGCTQKINQSTELLPI